MVLCISILSEVKTMKCVRDVVAKPYTKKGVRTRNAI